MGVAEQMPLALRPALPATAIAGRDRERIQAECACLTSDRLTLGRFGRLPLSPRQLGIDQYRVRLSVKFTGVHQKPQQVV
jgi:hypothetical protein